MRKMFKLLIVLFLLYFTIQYLFYFIGKGHNITYTLKNGDIDITIDEILTINKDISDGYYFNVKFDNYSIPFKVLKKYSRQKYIVNKVDTYYGDIYVCAGITLKSDDNVSDIKCIKDNIIYFYSYIKGQDTKLDELVSASGYDITKYTNDNSNYIKDGITYYPNNYVDDYNILLGYYKGVYLFGRSVTGNARYVSLFANDKYIKEIEGLSGKYYVIPDYNNSHEFLKFYSINITTGVLEEIMSDKYISFSSFVQGEVDDKLYIIDMENKIQYYIDAKHKAIVAVGNQNSGAQVYTSDGWITNNINEVIDRRIKFYDNDISDLNNERYDKLKLMGNDSGTYYLYIKNGSVYDTYLVYAQDSLYTKNYIFSCTDVDRINYKDGYVYYLYDDEIRVFGPNVGNKTLIKFSELKYNSNLNYFIY